jgi:hypothetical protein
MLRDIRDYDTQVILSKSEIPCWLNWSHKSKHFGQKNGRPFRRCALDWKKKDIERWIEMCPSCEVTKPNNLVAPLKAIVSQRKRQRIQIDFFDVGKRNKDPIQKHRYVLTIIDCFTKRAWLRPFQTKSGDKVGVTRTLKSSNLFEQFGKRTELEPAFFEFSVRRTQVRRTQAFGWFVRKNSIRFANS